MTQLLMDDNDDVAIVNNTFVFTKNDSDEEIRQRILQSLRLFLGEWFLDNTIGIPWFQTIMIKGTPPEIIETEIKAAIIGSDGVESLQRFDPLDFTVSTRELKVSFDVATINGNNLTINEVLP